MKYPIVKNIIVLVEKKNPIQNVFVTCKTLVIDLLEYFFLLKLIFCIFFLQVLISIQSLILCLEPYYNEPGFERLYGTPQGDSESLKYSEDVFRNNLKYAVLGQLTNPPEGFEEVVRAHFYLKRDFLLEVCKLYLGFFYYFQHFH